MKRFLSIGLVAFVGGVFAHVGAVSIGDVQLRFCNEVETDTGVFQEDLQKSVSFDMDRGQTQELCMQFTNLGSESITIQSSFVDGTITNGTAKNKACKDQTNIEQFGKYVSGDLAPFTIAPGQAVRKYANMQFDGDVGGQIYGCVTYFESKELEKSQNGMFKVLVRRANFVDVLLSGDIVGSLVWLDYGQTERKNFSPNSKIFLTKSNEVAGHELLLSFKNDGSVTQMLQLTGTMKNMFGQEREILAQERDVPMGNTTEIKQLVESLPWYGGFVRVNIDVTHQAVINFDGENLSDDLKDSHMMHQEARFFLFTWWLLLFVALFCILVYVIIYLLLRHREHKKNVKKAPYAHRVNNGRAKVSSKKTGSASPKSAKTKSVKKSTVTKKSPSKTTKSKSTKPKSAKTGSTKSKTTATKKPVAKKTPSKKK